MLSYAASFWPLFWTVLGGGLVLAALESLLVATFPPTRLRPEPAPARPRPTTELRAGRRHHADRETKAA
jgi:hypothetical protein